MTFKDRNREFQEIAKELDYVRTHNLKFTKYDPSMLLMAEGALVLLAFERFMRMILGSEATKDDSGPLGSLFSSISARCTHARTAVSPRVSGQIR
jgi:hypothetical protein